MIDGSSIFQKVSRVGTKLKMAPNGAAATRECTCVAYLIKRVLARVLSAVDNWQLPYDLQQQYCFRPVNLRHKAISWLINNIDPCWLLELGGGRKLEAVDFWPLPHLTTAWRFCTKSGSKWQIYIDILRNSTSILSTLVFRLWCVWFVSYYLQILSSRDDHGEIKFVYCIWRHLQTIWRL